MPVVDGQEYELLNYEDLKHFHHQLVEHKHVDPTETSTIVVKTSDSSLLGCSVNVTIAGHEYVNKFPDEFDDTGYATVKVVVSEIGVATVTASDGSDEVTESVEITEFYQTKEVELSLRFWLYRNGNEFEVNSGGWKQYTGDIVKNADNIQLTNTVNRNSSGIKSGKKIDKSGRLHIKMKLNGDLTYYIGTATFVNEVTTSSRVDFQVTNEYAEYTRNFTSGNSLDIMTSKRTGYGDTLYTYITEIWIS